MTSMFKSRFILIMALATGPPGYAADADKVEDLLQARWFEIEIIIFERLNVLDVNATEALTLNAPRYWPHNLLELDRVMPAASAEMNTPPVAEFNPLSVLLPWCLGYPALPYEDPLHPSLMPPDPSELDTIEEPDQLTTALPAEDSAVEDTAIEAEQLDPDTPLDQFMAEIKSFEADLYATSYRPLAELALANEVKAINRQNHLRPLIHQRWRQPVPERDNPQPVYLATESNADSPLTHAGLAKLEGHIAVTVGRYLHITPKLWYHADNLGLAPVALPVHGQPQGPDNRLHMELDESRRLRSGDLHYLDHPKFGLIVRIDPIAIPEALTSTLQALNEAAEDTL